jgi:hypothetical protein
MDNLDKRARRFLQNIWLQIALAVIGLVSGLFAIEDKFRASPSVWISGGSGLLLLISFGFVRREFTRVQDRLLESRTQRTLLENKLAQVEHDYSALRQCPALTHKINHDYRDVLSQLFGPIRASAPSEDKRRYAEMRTLTAVCQKIAQIFTVLTGSHCVVTVKLIDDPQEHDGRYYCKTYARSETSRRDEGPNATRLFQLKTQENTALDAALTYTPGHTARFFASDLAQYPKYRNERQDWADFYRSAIVVPIRCVRIDGYGSVKTDDIGFLTVDTMEPNRLENTIHPEILAGFADQMYNFMSLMRGTYSVSARN